MMQTVLLVDDAPLALAAIARVLGDIDARVLTAGSGEQALEVMLREDVHVVVCDYEMPKMNGARLLSAARALRPEVIRIMLTGRADLQTAVDAINQGEVFRFLQKPWSNDELRDTVVEALTRYQLVRSLRTADEGTIRSLAQTVELKDPYTRGHCDRVADYALQIAGRLGLPADHVRDIKHGSWLHDCGKIGVPESILNYPGRLTPEMFSVIQRHPGWGADVARQAALPQRVINVILFHHERIDGHGYESGITGAALPLEARIVAPCDVFDAMTTERPYKPAASWAEGIRVLQELAGTGLDADITKLFVEILQGSAEARA